MGTSHLTFKSSKMLRLCVVFLACTGAAVSAYPNGDHPPFPETADRADGYGPAITEEEFAASALLKDDGEDHTDAIYGSNEFEGDIAGVSELDRNAINTDVKKE